MLIVEKTRAEGRRAKQVSRRMSVGVQRGAVDQSVLASDLLRRSMSSAIAWTSRECALLRFESGELRGLPTMTRREGAGARVTLSELASLGRRWTLSIDEVGRGDPACAIDDAGTFVAIATQWETGPTVLVVELASGRVAHRAAPLASHTLFGAPSTVFTIDDGWRPPGVEGSPELVELSLAGVSRRAPLPRPHLVDVAPDGRSFAVFDREATSIHGWPDLLETHRFEAGHGMAIDWATRTIVFTPASSDEPQAWSFATATVERRPVALRAGESAIALGAGLVARHGPGLVLASLTHGWRREILPPHRKDVVLPSLDSTGTRIRLFLGSKPRVVVVDPRSGDVVEVPPREEWRRKTYGVFHPSLDVAVYSKSRAQPSVDLRLCHAGQPIVARLGPDLDPLAWTPDGRALLTTRTEGSRRWLELWSTAPG